MGAGHLRSIVPVLSCDSNSGRASKRKGDRQHVARDLDEAALHLPLFPPPPPTTQVMILVGANVYTSGQVTPDANDYNNYFGVTTSIILRMGIEAFFFLVLFIGQVRGGGEDWRTGLAHGGCAFHLRFQTHLNLKLLPLVTPRTPQYLWKKLIYYPYVHNPITQFIDLMYLANISTVLFDDSHGGYYLHGRNMAQHSDTTLRWACGWGGRGGLGAGAAFTGSPCLRSVNDAFPCSPLPSPHTANTRPSVPSPHTHSQEAEPSVAQGERGPHCTSCADQADPHALLCEPTQVHGAEAGAARGGGVSSPPHALSR